MPSDDTAQWRDQMRGRLTGIDRSVYPMLAESMSMFANRAFILRWDSGINAPLDKSYTFYIETMIGGLQAMLDIKTARKLRGAKSAERLEKGRHQ